ncbi:MAG: hypothetical protein RMJ84_01665 [Sandaracinaceae bacterium]|nr:hypothetical protein [Sandaracinaceae bacterium]
MRHWLPVCSLSMVFLLFSACSQESNYCDDLFCYSCDGYSCRRLDPPFRPPCRCDHECTVAGSDCTSLGCTQRCDDDSDCPLSTRCRGGYCLAPSETVSDATCTCRTSADCGGQGVICRNGTCVRGCSSSADCAQGQSCIDGSCRSTMIAECTATRPCAQGFECIDGECKRPSDVCRFSSECGSGRVCVNQRCTTACETNANCPRGARCEQGFCIEERPTPSGCTTNSDCGAGKVCRDSRCYEACENDDQCGSGRYCFEGRCRLDDRPRPSCGPTAGCRQGSICLNGTCRIPCSRVEDCYRSDGQYNYCLMNVCATTNEATSNCRSASDCRSQLCVDGVCR